MKALLVTAVVCVGGCEHKQPPDSPPVRPIMIKSSDPIAVTWKLVRDADGKTLTLDYVIENHGTAPVWVLDQIVTTGEHGMIVMPDRVIVRRGADAATASFVIGFTEQPGHAVEIQPSPVPHELAIGAKLSGTKKVPLPLASWHPYDSMIDPLQGAPTKAVLEIGWLPKEPPAGIRGWEDVPAAAGGTLHLPWVGFVRTSEHLARGEVVTVP